MRDFNSQSAPHDTIAQLRRECEKLSAKVESLSSLIEVSMIINSTLNLDELMILVMEKAQSVMEAEASSVMTINEEKNVLVVPVALGEVGDKMKKIEIPIDAGIAGWVATHGEPLIIPDAYKDPRFNPAVDKETGFRTRSILAAPLKVKDKLIGVAEVINRADGNPFNEDDLKLFSAFCRLVAMAIENARIHQLELERERLEQQLETAKFIQQSFMPETFPASPDQQYEISARSLAAASVGGDYFDFVEFDGQSIGVSIGDVSGKGIPAALFMARLVSDFRLHARNHSNPAELMITLNKALCERSRRGMFVTSQYGILDAGSGEFVFANAGHLPLIRIHSRTRRIELLSEGGGIPLGISPHAEFERMSVRLNEGDFLVWVTDGVVEAKNRSGEAYTFERLTQLLAATQPGAEAVIDAIVSDVQTFAGGSPQHDDLTAVVLKWR